MASDIASVRPSIAIQRRRSDVNLIERSRNLSEIAFHEKASRSQVDSVLVSWNIVCLPAEWPLLPCFHPHSRGAIVSLGASLPRAFTCRVAPHWNGIVGYARCLCGKSYFDSSWSSGGDEEVPFDARLARFGTFEITAEPR